MAVYSKVITNQWKRTAWRNLAIKYPIRHKAYRLKMSLTTFKIKNSWTLADIYDKICKPLMCPYCEKIMDFEEISVDHIIARSDGGSCDISNIVFCCLRCNQLKGGLTGIEYKELLLIAKQYPNLMRLYEKRIKPQLAFFSNKKLKRWDIFNSKC